MNNSLELDSSANQEQVIKAPVKLKHSAFSFGYGLRILWRLFNDKGVWAHASVCGYSTILSLVPIMAISLTIISAFTSSESVTVTSPEGRQEEVFSNRVFDFFFDHFIPGAADSQHVEVLHAKRGLLKFVDNTKSLRFVILILLIVASVSLFNSIEHAFNEIWSVRHRRNLFARFLAYWILLTITPLLLALSYYYTTEFASTEAVSSFMTSKWGEWIFLHGVSYILTMFAFLVANRYLPNLHVALIPSLIGSALSAILWETAKVIFDYYINYALTTEGYYSIFGTLAAIPLFICWLYYGYLCFLLGPVIATTIQDYDRHLIRLRRRGNWESHTPLQTIYVFLDICRHFKEKQFGISQSQLEELEEMTFLQLKRCLRELEKAKLVHQDNQAGMYYPNGNPNQISLKDVLGRLLGIKNGTLKTSQKPDKEISTTIQSMLDGKDDVTITMLIEQQIEA